MPAHTPALAGARHPFFASCGDGARDALGIAIGRARLRIVAPEVKESSGSENSASCTAQSAEPIRMNRWTALRVAPAAAEKFHRMDCPESAPTGA